MTERAKKLLKDAEGASVIKDKIVLKDLFKKNDIVDFDAFIDFHLKFGGLKFYAGLEPIVWGIQHVSPRGEFKYYPDGLVTFNHPGEYPELSVLCADTLYQIRWTIDKNGAIFEDFDVMTNSFESFLEDYALWKELISTKFVYSEGIFMERN